MPVYQYCCETCGHEFDLFRVSVSALHPAVCPECGGTAAKVFNPAAVHLQVPERFRRHVTTTGLKDELGSGPGLDVNAHRRRSSCETVRRLERSASCPAS